MRLLEHLIQLRVIEIQACCPAILKSMKRPIILAVLLLTVICFGFLPATAFAAKPIKPEAGGNSKPEATVEMKGYDVSYPQCGKKLPTDHYFAIVGVNGGNAAIPNNCLADQLVWANQAKTGSKQPRVQLYVNTANPAQEPTYNWASWPTSGSTPYGLCEGERNNSTACSWQYGWNRSVYTEGVFKAAAESKALNTNTVDYVWWLDVETMNSWQSGSADALARNRAAIEGFAAYYQSKNAQVGLYSTEYQWGEIVGKTLISEGNLTRLANWRPSGASLSNAKANCNLAPLTANGFMSLTQYVIKNLDHNHSCI
jgi:hypothetical protein